MTIVDRFIFFVGFVSSLLQLTTYLYLLNLWIINNCNTCVISENLIESYLLIVSAFYLFTFVGGFVFTIKHCITPPPLDE